LPTLRPSKILLINKIDLVEKSALLRDCQGPANERARFAATFMVLGGFNGDDVWRCPGVARPAVAGKDHGTIPADQITDAAAAAIGG